MNTLHFHDFFLAELKNEIWKGRKNTIFWSILKILISREKNGKNRQIMFAFAFQTTK